MARGRRLHGPQQRSRLMASRPVAYAPSVGDGLGGRVMALVFQLKKIVSSRRTKVRPIAIKAAAVAGRRV